MIAALNDYKTGDMLRDLVLEITEETVDEAAADSAGKTGRLWGRLYIMWTSILEKKSPSQMWLTLFI